MSWYDDTYRKRVAITIVNTGGTSSPDANVVIPTDFDDFWDAQTTAGDTTGIMLRVTSADGATLLNYSVDDGAGGAWSTSARTGRIQIDELPAPGTAANEIVLCWLYYDPSTTVLTAAVATTITSAETGYIEQARPSGAQIDLGPPRPGSTVPAVAFSLATTEQRYVWGRIGHLLQPRSSASQTKLLYEEAWAMTASAKDDAGGATAGLVTAGRFVEILANGRREMWVIGQVNAGVAASGTNYTIILTLRTITPASASARQILDSRIGVRCYDVLEAAP